MKHTHTRVGYIEAGDKALSKSIEIDRIDTAKTGTILSDRPAFIHRLQYSVPDRRLCLGVRPQSHKRAAASPGVTTFQRQLLLFRQVEAVDLAGIERRLK
jgi:hypothetical protein